MVAAQDAGPRIGGFVVAALAFGQVLVSLDASVVNVALPSIQNELGSTSGQMQMIVVAYMITLAGLILPIAAFSDRIGRKPVYLFGALLFVVGSALCGISWDTWILIAARAIQGVGAGHLALIGRRFFATHQTKLLVGESPMGRASWTNLPRRVLVLTFSVYRRSLIQTISRLIAKSKVPAQINAKNLYTDRLKCAPG